MVTKRTATVEARCKCGGGMKVEIEGNAAFKMAEQAIDAFWKVHKGDGHVPLRS